MLKSAFSPISTTSKASKDLATEKYTARIGRWDESFVSNNLDVVSELVRAAYAGRDATPKICEVIVERLVALNVVADRARLVHFRDTTVAFP